MITCLSHVCTCNLIAIIFTKALLTEESIGSKIEINKKVVLEGGGEKINHEYPRDMIEELIKYDEKFTHELLLKD